MLRRLCFLLLSGLAVSATAGTPLDAYGRLPSIEQAALSPDGSTIAFIQTTQDWRVLAIIDLNASKVVGVTRVGDEKVRSVEWADDDHLLVTIASSAMPIGLWGENTEWHLMTVYNRKTNKWIGLLNNVRDSTNTMNVVYGRPVIQHKGNETLLYIHGQWVRDRTEAALFRVNLSTGTEALVKEGGDATREWVVDDSGEIVAEQDYFESDRRWVIRLLNGGRAQQSVSGIAAVDVPGILGLSADGGELIVAQNEADRITWKPLLIKDGTWGPEMSVREQFTELVLKEGSQRMIGTRSDGDETRYHFVDPDLKNSWDWIVRAFAYQRVELVSVSSDHSKILVEVFGPKSGYGYFLADVKEHLTRQVGQIYAGVTKIAEVRPIKYPATDGVEIPAYLTLPPDRPAKDLAIIVLPHGGPQVRDSLRFDWWAQALAAQGYAVLQPNYRGSALGKHWIEAGYGEWGHKMQTDLSDGVNYLAAEGIADPKRACIVGASYGGYAALAGVSIQSGIYHCAVAVAGISDPATMTNWIKRKESYGDKLGLRYWERFLGVDDPADKKLDAISPLKHAAQITVPLLLIHGRDDTTVPYDQSSDMAKALKRAGKSVEFVTLDKEDHYLSRSTTRLQMLQSSVDFLKKYNPPD